MSLLVLADLTYALALMVERDHGSNQTVGRLCIEYITWTEWCLGFLAFFPYLALEKLATPVPKVSE